MPIFHEVANAIQSIFNNYNNWGQSKINLIQSSLSKINKIIHGKIG